MNDTPTVTPISPWLKSPLTDLTQAMVSHQWYGACADMEMKALDCLEAYGLDRGLTRCETLIKDFQECAQKNKQYKRITAMRLERHRQVFAGERSKAERYAPGPPHDSY
ncbi:unnamed protein product [Acanthoscelides obtectus]|uniref:NADH dehydrogenase [ubiquinone] iron-sulfur protein 5 n=1 Tax=Acanthoscelides obtectus TaxID=200917 RepID=A0A9P0JXG3_ACAOB|nr:unnamed protein product [Acanthoscelides obtectus]CAK1657095.1 hypothetical protein AOBTE_LOCUS20117 [Acanthoscelides obtectus]